MIFVLYDIHHIGRSHVDPGGDVLNALHAALPFGDDHQSATGSGKVDIPLTVHRHPLDTHITIQQCEVKVCPL